MRHIIDQSESDNFDGFLPAISQDIELDDLGSNLSLEIVSEVEVEDNSDFEWDLTQYGNLHIHSGEQSDPLLLNRKNANNI